MTAGPYRLARGGEIDRARTIEFSFDGRPMTGFDGDTLASALLANGRRIVARSFKYHRPRGIYAAGVDEPAALVTLGQGASGEPNTAVTQVALKPGLQAFSQNCWPSPGFDLMAINNRLSRFLPAGFYYKTFMWPKSFWLHYEKFIRRAAGMGVAPGTPDPDSYAHRHGFCDVLVVGAGMAGMAAARAAASEGARVLLVEQEAQCGTGLLADGEPIDGQAPLAWRQTMLTELLADERITVLNRTTAFGIYDGNTVGLIETLADPTAEQPRQRMHIIRPRAVVLASGALERPLVFANNDLPGCILAGAAWHYATRFAVAPGRRVVSFTNNDSAYLAALGMRDAGVNVDRIVDSRAQVNAELRERVHDAGIEVSLGAWVTGAVGGKSLRAVTVSRTDGAARRRIDCDALCVSGGWSPVVHLHSQAGARPGYRADIAAHCAGGLRAGLFGAGACEGVFAPNDCVTYGQAAGIAAARHASGRKPPALAAPRRSAYAVEPLWEVPGSGKKFVDLQDDVTSADIALAHREGYESVEHLKRYTTLGMGTDQGKTANVNGLAILAGARGMPIEDVGSTTFRPPYTPVALGALAGSGRGAHFAPLRQSPMHDWHVAHGAVMLDAGLWRRPWYYPRDGESMTDAYIREARQVRESVGMVDVTSLGKIDVQGPDAAEFLNRVYVNGWKKLAVGRARYGVMLRDDGMVFDDGTTTRLAENRFFMTTTTANAVRVMAHMEFLLAVAWPDLRVNLTTVTEQYAGIAVAGPRSRALLAKVVHGVDLSDQGLPFMGVGSAQANGVPLRVQRISFSGELAYEIYVESAWGAPVWDALYRAGEEMGVICYGTEAMAALRIEKGHVAGPELDGRTTLEDLRLEGLDRGLKAYVGSVLRNREALVSAARPRLVGLRAEPGDAVLRTGAILFPEGETQARGHGIGHVSSATYSPVLGVNIALGFARDVHEGDKVSVHYPLKNEVVAARIVAPCQVDPDGGRMRV